MVLAPIVFLKWTLGVSNSNGEGIIAASTAMRPVYSLMQVGIFAPTVMCRFVGSNTRAVIFFHFSLCILLCFLVFYGPLYPLNLFGYQYKFMFPKKK